MGPSWGGPVHCQNPQGGIQNPICIPTTTVSGSISEQFLQRPSEKPCPPPSGGGHVEQKGHSTFNSTGVGGLLFKTVSGTQKDRGMASSHRFVGSEQICSLSDFQNGHARECESHAPTRNVGHIHRPEGCLFSYSHPPKAPKVSTLSGAWKGVSVQGPTLWSKHSPKAVYQSGSPAEKDGGRHGHPGPPVYRRLAEQGTVRERSGSQDSISIKSDRGVGLDSELGKVRTGSFAGFPVSGLPIRSSQRAGLSHRETVPETNSGTVSSVGKPPYNTSHVDDSIRSHGSNFQVGTLRAPTYETNTKGSCSSVGLEVSSGHANQNLIRGAGTHSMVDHQRQCHGGCTITPTTGNVGGLHGCVYGGLGCTLHLPHRSGQMECSGTVPPHKCPGAESCFQSSSGIYGLSHQQTCSNCYRQYNCCSIHKQTGRHSLLGAMCPTLANTGMVSDKEHCSICQTHTRLHKCHCRPSVPQGPDTSHGVVSASRHFFADMPNVGYSHDRPLCNSFQQQVASVCFASPRPVVSDGGRFVDGLGGEIPVCLSSDGGHSSDHQKTAVHPELHTSVDRSLLADQALVPRTKTKVVPSSVAVTTSVVPAQAATDYAVSQECSSSEPACMVAAGRSDGIDEEIQERIDNPHRQSTSLVYSGKWEIFQKWCDDHEVASKQPTVKELSRFFLYLFKDKGLQPGTIQGYRSAISNKLYGSVQWDISHDPSLTRLLDSFFRDRPVTARCLPPWDLRVVLQSLTQAPFEPMALAPLKWVTLKTCFLVTLASGKRRSEVHALLHSRLRADDNWSKVIIEPSNRFIAKNQLARDGTAILQPIVIPSLSATLGRDLSEDRSLCPVRALRYYLDRTKDLRGNRELLFISHRTGHKTEIHKNTISSWLVQTIRQCLQHCSDDSARLCHVKSHDIRALAASWAFKSGVALDDVMKACSWKAHNTFTSFYLKDVSLSNPEGKISLGPVVAAQQTLHL